MRQGVNKVIGMMGPALHKPSQDSDTEAEFHGSAEGNEDGKPIDNGNFASNPFD